MPLTKKSIVYFSTLVFMLSIMLTPLMLTLSYVYLRLRTNCENKIFGHILVPGNANHDSHRFLGADK